MTHGLSRTVKGHTGFVFSVAWSPDGKRILSASEDDTLKLWDAETSAEKLTLKGKNFTVAQVLVNKGLAWETRGIQRPAE